MEPLLFFYAMKWLSFLWLTAFCLLYSISAATAAENWKTYEGSGFSILLPPGIKAESSRLIDFVLVDFTHGKRGFLNCYVGYAASFPGTEDPSAESSSEKINGIKVKVVTHHSRDKSIPLKEYFFERPIEKHPDLHIWYGNLSGQDLVNAEKAIHSIRWK